MNDKVLILDFGSQYTKLIARRVRELKVYSEIVPFHISIDKIRQIDPGAIILSGGPASVYDNRSPKVDPNLFHLGLPILGICYGLQLMAFNGDLKVIPAKKREYGLANLEIISDKGLLSGVKNNSKIWMSHGDKIDQSGSDFLVTAKTTNTEVAVVESKSRKMFGVQFHPEVVHTEEGKKILANFLFSLAGLKASWNMENFIEKSVQKIRQLVKDEKVILGLSGGVDSTVLAMLLRRAIGDQLIPIFIDTGLLRKNEYDHLMDQFTHKLNLKVMGIQASDAFFTNLKNVRSPERKRKIIGRTFIEVFQSVEAQIGPVKFFAQGTLYPDVIESKSVKGPSSTIKSHHNVGGLPKKIKYILIEPFRELFKDEVRQIGRKLGLDEEFIQRHPFPGPGLAVRILGQITHDRVKRLQEADAILIQELLNFNIYDQVWQAFVVLLPLKTVGVMGDERTYENIAAIRMVQSVDGMTANCFSASIEFLSHIANRIVNEVKGINRVVYDLTSKPPGTIEWE